MVENEPTDQSSDDVAEDQITKSFLHETQISEEQNFGHRETVKRMVFQNCRSTSVSGHILYHMTCFVVCPLAHYVISLSYIILLQYVELFFFFIK